MFSLPDVAVDLGVSVQGAMLDFPSSFLKGTRSTCMASDCSVEMCNCFLFLGESWLGRLCLRTWNVVALALLVGLVGADLAFGAFQYACLLYSTEAAGGLGVVSFLLACACWVGQLGLSFAGGSGGADFLLAIVIFFFPSTSFCCHSSSVGIWYL